MTPEDEKMLREAKIKKAIELLQEALKILSDNGG